MSTEIVVALCALAGTALGTIASSKLVAYRIEQLEKKVDKHNGLIERMYCVEGRVTVLESKGD